MTTEKDLRDLAVARDIAASHIRLILDLPDGDYERTVDADLAHLLAAAVIHIQWVPLDRGGDRWICPACEAVQDDGHDAGCIIAKALEAWMNGGIKNS